VGVWTPGTRCASSTHNDDGASSFSEVWTLVSDLTLWNSLRDALFPSWGFWELQLGYGELFALSYSILRQNETIERIILIFIQRQSIATIRMVSIPNDQFEHRQSKGSRMFPSSSSPACLISSLLTLRYCYVIRRVVGDLTVGVPPVYWLFWIWRAAFWAPAVALMTFY
jgi:hypothetical protein